jgi:hypothetical protein
VFASDHTQDLEDIRLPNKAGSTTFETVARSLIHRHIVAGFVKKHCREDSCNKGLGFETARRSKSEGYRVYVGVRQPERRADAAVRLGVE